MTMPLEPGSSRTAADTPVAGLSRGRLERMAAAADEVARCERALAKSAGNVVAELLRDSGTFYEWEHYPKGDVYDPDSHAQYYYHAHAAGERPKEHGHFHTFLRQPGMPKGARPALRPIGELRSPGKAGGAKGAKAGPPEEALSHIVGIGIDRYGRARSLFTTNCWVTGETWYHAKDVVAMIDRFNVELARPSWLVNRWVSSVIVLFRPQIEALLHERDRAVEAHRQAHPSRDVFEDRALEVTSEVRIDVGKQSAAVLATLGRG